ncbi:MAG TPA: dihydroorotase [Ignavibacteriaceae bacterium]|nr:dihydroorotase [Ignavibacteriaceae bacterium]
MKVILKNVSLFHPAQKIDEKGIDILLTDGVISKIGKIKAEEISGAKIFDLTNKHIVPGFFDMHVHLREPGREDEETVITGCNAAANGGFTGIACMPNTEPAIDSAEIVTFIKEKSKDHLVDVEVIGAATLDRKGEYISPMAELYEAGAVGFSDDGVAIKTAGILKRAFEYSKMYNVPIIEHCEDETLAGGAMNEGINSTMLGLPPIPSVAEELIVIRDIMLAEYTGGKIHIAHISTKKSVEMVREAKRKGIAVTSEVTPHHFTLIDDSLKSYDTNLKMNPPLRTRADIDEILLGLQDGTIDCISSDHAPHSAEEKEAEFEHAPNGITGLETQVGLALTELYHKKVITLEQLIEKMAINPRKILNLPIPSIEAGQIANFTILDLNEIFTFDISKSKSKSKNSPFDKRLLTGRAIGVINNSKMFYQDEFLSI